MNKVGMQAEKRHIVELIRSQVEGGDLLLVIPPGNALDCIPLGAYTLQAVAKQQGYTADILHLDFLLARWIGMDTYKAVQETVMNAYYQLLMERLFARSAFDVPALGYHHEAIYDQAFATGGIVNSNSYNNRAVEAQLDHLQQLEQRCYDFIEVVAEALAHVSYRVVGSAIIYENQLIPGIALFRKLEALLHQTAFIAGGAYFYEKGREAGVKELPTALDYIFVGEAEGSLMDLLAQSEIPKASPPQIVSPSKGPSLEKTPHADYEAYAQQVIHILGEDFFSQEVKVFWYESNRGCWWGDIARCTFCSIPQGNFRRKLSQTVKENLTQIQARFPDKTFLFTDNIMAESFPAEYVQFFEQDEPKPMVGFQLKVSKKLADVKALHQINTRWVMPGIESFSTSLLKRMKKGTTGKDNLYFLRNALSHGISVQYLLLWGFPGDQREEYEYLLDLIPRISHLRNPDFFTFALIGKGAPLYKEAAGLGVTDLIPWKAYEAIFPKGADVKQLAHFFRASFPSQAYESPDLIQAISDSLSEWKQSYVESELRIVPIRPGSYLIRDVRLIHQMKPQTYMVDEDRARVLMTLKRFDPTRTTALVGR
ncbi:MAG: RiPP maturation radical SAM C-methyltransferase [Bacteroidota bacterium]